MENGEISSRLRKCPKEALIESNEVYVVNDTVVALQVDSVHETVYTIPSDLDMLVKGFVVARAGACSDERHVVLRTDTGIRVLAEKYNTRCSPIKNVMVECKHIRDAIKQAYNLSPKIECPAALHFGVAFVLEDDGFKPVAIIHDVSRHALAYKLAGVLRALRQRFDSIVEPMAFLSARVDGDIVSILSKAGYRIVVSFHHPILSALKAALRYGATLVLRDKRNELFVAIGNDVADCKPRLEELARSHTNYSSIKMTVKTSC